MTRFLALVTLAGIFCTLSPLPIVAQTKPTSIAGKWKMSIDFPDGARSAGLEIKQDSHKITGRFIAAFAGGDVALEGEFADGRLTFSASTTGGPHPGMQLDFSGNLKDDGTLAGSLSAPFGDFRWSAERID